MVRITARPFTIWGHQDLRFFLASSTVRTEQISILVFVLSAEGSGFIFTVDSRKVGPIDGCGATVTGVVDLAIRKVGL